MQGLKQSNHFAATVVSEAQDIFDDVDDSFSSIAAIRSKFERWKFEFNNTYKQAFVSMSIPHLFSPFVR